MRGTTRGRSSGEGIYEPNMTPLIDVSLVLVVILMVATPLAFQSSIAVNTTASSGRSAREKARTERTELLVRSDGSVCVNRALVSRDGLAAALRPLIRSSATRLVVVRCEPGVTHGAFVSVVDEAKSLGAAEIAVVGS